jgi:hypothetical protein
MTFENMPNWQKIITLTSLQVFSQVELVEAIGVEPIKEVIR